MTAAERDQILHDYLPRQRWFAGKGRDFTIAAVHPLAPLAVDDDGLPVRVEIVTVGYADGTSESYQLPLAYRPAQAEDLGHALVGSWDAPELGRRVWAYAALQERDAVTLWLSGILAERTLPDQVFRRVSDFEVPAERAPLVLSGEQSNTSVAFAETALLKVFRRVEHGANPDIAVHEAMTLGKGRHIAPLLGAVSGEWPGPDGRPGRGDLAMLSTFFRTASSGWDLAIASVRDLFAEADLHADEVGGDFAAESHRLGVTTAEVHEDLRRLLPTATWGAAELARTATRMRARLTAAVGAVAELAAFEAGLARIYDALEHLDRRVDVQRIHGDFHLGQVLRTSLGWRVIDFEGEPAKSVGERVGLDPPVRDVAGMLRSFDYAARHLLAGTAANPQLAYRAGEWSERNRAAFCAGYAEAAGIDVSPDGELGPLTRAFEADKAVYEAVYEARMRPTWLAIPLGAIERLAG